MCTQDILGQSILKSTVLHTNIITGSSDNNDDINSVTGGQIVIYKTELHTFTNVSPMIFRFSSGLVVMLSVLLMRFLGVRSSSDIGRVVVPL